MPRIRGGARGAAVPTPRRRNARSGGAFFGGGAGSAMNFHQYGFARNPRQYDEEDYSDSDDGDGSQAAEMDVDDVIDVENEQFIGSMRGEIVGLRYYQGEISRGELVQLVREQHNNYDPNAVRVDNSLGVQIGHIKREMARALAGVMDKKLARVEGRAPTNKNTFSMPVDLSFYGRAENAQQVKDAMAKQGYPLSTNEIAKGHCSYNQFDEGGQRSDAMAMEEYKYTSTIKTVNSEELNKELDKMFETLREGDKLLNAEPAKLIATPLFPHQKQALAWMIKRENDDDLPPFWNNTQSSANRTVYRNSLTGLATDRRPDVLRGGMLADDMGLGKTLEVIALIATNGPDGKPMKLRNGVAPKSSTAKQRYSSAASKKRKLPPATPKTPNQPGSPRRPSSTRTSEHVMKKLRETRERSYSPSPAPASTKATISKSDSRFEKQKDPPGKVGIVNLDSDDSDGDVFPGNASKPSSAAKVPTGKGRRGLVEPASKRIRVSAKRLESDDSDYELLTGDSVPAITQEVEIKTTGEVQRKEYNAVEDDDDDDDDILLSRDPNISESPSKIEEDFEFEMPGDIDAHARGTLIICPMSVMQNWEDQLEQHFHPNAYPYLNVHRQYGNNLLSTAELKKMDVVITTFQTMTSAWKRKKDPLFEVDWLRLVLDEAHVIRNPLSQMSKAACELKARRRWVLTGTPIQNRLLDLWSIVRFLRVKPLDQRVFWRQCIERPISKGFGFGFKCIRGLMVAMAMRRTKTQEIEPGKPLVDLPPREMCQETMEFTEDERMLYDVMLAEGRLTVNKYIEEGTFLHHYAQVLAILTRLRQLCCHPYLVRKAAQKAKELGLVASTGETAGSGNSNESRAQHNRELAQLLLQLINSSDSRACPICFEDPPNNAVMNPACKHYFCKECINDWIRTRQDAKCPMCRGILEPNHLVEAPSGESNGTSNGDDDWQTSVKVDAVMTHLLRLRQEDPTIKSIVISQFTSFLDVIEKPLITNKFNFTRLDGTMTADTRSDAVRAFQSTKRDSPTIFLLSMKAGGVGINLTAATRVFLMDPAWNPAVEEQCFDRCHRLGQTKEVRIVKFIVGNTIEERMLELQERKRLLMVEAFGGAKKKRDEKELINQVRALLS